MAKLLVVLIVTAVALLVSNSGPVSAMSEGALKPVTVCEVLQNLKALNGDLVAVLGRWRAWDEGLWLDADSCTPPLKTDGFQWPSGIWLRADESGRSRSRTDMTLETDALRRALREASRHTALSKGADRWAVVYGRLQTREKLITVTMTDGTLYGYGFGHLNAAPAQLVFSYKNVTFLSESMIQELLKTN